MEIKLSDFSNQQDRAQEQRLNRAAPFRRDERMEELARLRDEHPDQFAAQPPAA